jgi:hypothetical protein
MKQAMLRVCCSIKIYYLCFGFFCVGLAGGIMVQSAVYSILLGL